MSLEIDPKTGEPKRKGKTFSFEEVHLWATPIHSARFASNWELSAARAISVVKFLITQGIPASHLAATGFGENQPVDPSNNPAAFAKNRRIEIRLNYGN